MMLINGYKAVIVTTAVTLPRLTACKKNKEPSMPNKPVTIAQNAPVACHWIWSLTENKTPKPTITEPIA